MKRMVGMFSAFLSLVCVSVTAKASPYIMETESRTINLDNTMTTGEIQDAIDSVGKHLMSGVVITFQL